MFVRCFQLFAALAVLTLVVGAPEQALAHGDKSHAVLAKLQVGKDKAVSAAAGERVYSLSTLYDRSGETSPQSSVGGASCICCGGGAGHGIAALVNFAAYIVLSRASPSPPTDAIRPPPRAPALLDHPPKSFA